MKPHKLWDIVMALRKEAGRWKFGVTFVCICGETTYVNFDRAAAPVRIPKCPKEKK